MELKLFTDMTQCTAEDVQRLLPLVSVQRREQALRYKHVFGQWTCLKAYELLLQLLFPKRDITTLSPDELPVFSYNEYGQPFLPNGPCFSISHCREAVAVAVGDTPVGIDVESIRRFDEALVRRTMNEEEQKRILSSTDSPREFIRFWTQKEAVLKCQGTGIVDDLTQVLISCSSLSLQMQDYPTFLLSIATK